MKLVDFCIKKKFSQLLSQNNFPFPLNPSGHEHVYDPGVLIHLALIPQALGLAHSFWSTQPPSGCDSVNPSGQLHSKPPSVFLHVAPFAHGLLLHSSISKLIFCYVWCCGLSFQGMSFGGISKTVTIMTNNVDLMGMVVVIVVWGYEKLWKFNWGLTYTFTRCIPHESVGTCALKATHFVDTKRITATWRFGTFVLVDAAQHWAGVSMETFRAVAAITTLKICAKSAGATSTRIGALVDV